MAKRIAILPVEPLELVLADGTTLTALFTNEAFAIFEDEFGAIDELANTEGVDRPYNFCAKLLYCGLKVVDKTVTLDEATAIIMSGGPSLMGEIMSVMMNNLTAGFDEETKVNFYKEVAQKINSLQG